MSWFSRDGSLRSSLRRKFAQNQPVPQFDSQTCFEAFSLHWQQALQIIENGKHESKPKGNNVASLSVDDVICVINHVDQMMTLLVQEVTSSRFIQPNHTQEVSGGSHTLVVGPILDYALLEGVLDRLFLWALKSGEYINLLKVELLKVYELLVSHCQQDILFHQPVVRPLLQLLSTCGESYDTEVEKRVVVLLNTLCVCLSQNPDLLEMFFSASTEHGAARFLMFSLLIPFIHREGAIGQQARDALLLCMALSRKHESIGIYVAESSNFCPVLATGLSGLYSALPKKLPVVGRDWCRFTPEDIQEMPELAMFLNSLEFCNAVVQVAHPLVQNQLVSYLHQGFLEPVLGPALHQDAVGLSVETLENTSRYSTSLEDVIATTAYIELFLRTVTEPDLLQVFLKFLLTASFESHRILDTLISRIEAKSTLCVVTLTLFRTLVGINCEDVMLELIFRYLLPCSHVMVSQKSRIRDIDMYCQSAEKLLALVPTLPTDTPSTAQSPMPQLCKHSVVDRLPVAGSLQVKNRHRTTSVSSFAFGELEIIDESLQRSLQRSVCLEEFQTFYMDYLRDAAQGVRMCAKACQNWSFPYNGHFLIEDAGKSSTPVAGDVLNSNSCSTTEVKVGKCDVISNISSTDSQGHHLDTVIEDIASETCKTLESEKESTVEETSKENISPVFLETMSDSENKTNYLPFCQEEDALWSILDTSSLAIQEEEEEVTELNKHLNILNSSTLEQWKTSAQSDSSASDSGMFESRESNYSSLNTETEDTLYKEEEEKQKSVESNLQSIKSKFILSLSKMSTETFLRQKSASPNTPSGFDTSVDPNIGPFLTVLLKKVGTMMENDVYTNLQLTGLISRLAIYPQPLLSSFLLSPSLVFQPSVKSLYQVLSSLKLKVESYFFSLGNCRDLLVNGHQFLMAREERLLGDVPPRLFRGTSYRRHGSFSETQTGEPRRQKFTNFLFKRGGFFGDKVKKASTSVFLESIPDNQGYRFYNRVTPESPEGKLESVQTKNAILCAIVFEEFLKELSAISQEHAVLQADPEFWDCHWKG